MKISTRRVIVVLVIWSVYFATSALWTGDAEGRYDRWAGGVMLLIGLKVAGWLEGRDDHEKNENPPRS